MFSVEGLNQSKAYPAKTQSVSSHIPWESVCLSLADELGAGAVPLQGAGTPRGYWTSGGVLVTPLVCGASLARFVAVERMAAAITPQ